MESFDFKESEADKCIFRRNVNDSVVYLALFVDDGLIAAKEQEAIDFIVTALKKSFEITLEDTRNFVGLQIDRDRANKSIIVHQTAYTTKIVEKFGMSGAKPMSVPADPHATLEPVKREQTPVNVRYREAVGSLMLLAIVSHPDIAYAVNNVSRYLNNHNKSHWQAVKRIFLYLVGTIDLGIEYRSGGSDFELKGFPDADYASDVGTRRSTTGYVFVLANGGITWSSDRQKSVSLSTTQSEYVAAAAAAKETSWLRKLLNDIGNQCEEPTVLDVGNQGAIRLVKNPEFHSKTKHIDVRHIIFENKWRKGWCQ